MPGTADHPITVAPAGVRIRVEAHGRTFVESGNPVALEEAGYPTVYYAPESDVRMDFLERSATVTHCPFKGDAAYYHAINPQGTREEDAFWVYENPPPDMAAIKGLFAADARKLTVVRETPGGDEII